MIAGLLGVLSLGVIATIVYQLARQGSQGPALVSSVASGISGFYGQLMK